MRHCSRHGVLRRYRPARKTGVLLLLALLIPFSPTAFAADKVITVAAAASLTNVVDDLGAAFTAATGTEVRTSFASSAVSARQVINGAPFDVFLSANRAWIDEVANRDAVLAEAIVPFASNRLVVAAHADMATAATLNDLISQAILMQLRIGIADPRSVPAGIYARQALESLGLWADVEPLLVYLQNARSVLAYVERGETPLGLVYATDINVTPTVLAAADIEPALHDEIAYVGAVPVSAADPVAGKAFLDFIATDAAQMIIESHGFLEKPGAAK